MDNEEKEQWDFVVYDRDTKEIVTVLLDLEHDPKFLINMYYVGVYIPHDEYKIDEEDGKGYFRSINKILYLDDYRGRYEE